MRRVSASSSHSFLLLTVAVGSVLHGALACERSFGVSRAAELAEFPDPVCVRAVLGQTEGIKGFNEWYWPKSDSDPEAVARSVRAHHFAYDDGPGVRVQLGIFEDAPGKIRWVQSYISGTAPRSQDAVDEARRMMMAVERGVESRCGIAELSARVGEVCSGVECGDVRG